MKTKHQDLLGFFPYSKYPKPTDNQVKALEAIERANGKAILEIPTGSGKTAVGYAFLQSRLEEAKDITNGPVFYIVPNKTLIDEVKQQHPDVKVAYGRREHQCLHYVDSGKNIPCSSILPCPHRVDQETGETKEEGVDPCPYYQDKYELKQGGIGCVTTAFYLYTMLFSKEFELPEGLVIDEVHQLARTVRNCLSYEISDWHLGKAIDLLNEFVADQAKILGDFLKTMIRIIKSRPTRQSTLLEAEELEELIAVLSRLNHKSVKAGVAEAIKSGLIDVEADAEVLEKLDILVYDVGRYLHSFEFSLETSKRHALNYTYAYWREELVGNERKQYVLVIKSYYVAGLIRKILSPNTVAMSATIGDPEILGFETGVEGKFYSFPSDFPAKNARIYMPTDTPNLAFKEQSRGDLNKTLRRTAAACHRFGYHGIRSMMVVPSNKEREKFVSFCEDAHVKAITYGNGIPPREAIARFKDGEGTVLVGTSANFAEGVDLPKRLAPVIFFLRPSWPSPKDPSTVFEERRFGSSRWRLWNWRVMIETRQVRGRNIRSVRDKGVTFFLSQQFRNLVHAALPDYDKASYRGELSFDEAVEDALELLK